MIRINLLPEEYRKSGRTPIKLLLAVTTAVALNGALVAWWSWSAVGIAGEIESERTAAQLEMDGLTPQVTYCTALESEAKQYKSREQTLAAITKSRISWTKKLDELVDVVNRGGDGQRHLIWLDDLAVVQTSDPKAKSAGTVRASGHSGSDKFAQVANFLEDLEQSSFISDFRPPAPPEGTQTLVDDTLVPPVAWSFPLSLTLKTAEEREEQAAAKPAPGKPAAGKPGAAKPEGARTEAAKPDAAKSAAVQPGAANAAPATSEGAAR
jgi:Tfp pilus assembly protein PilN